LRALLGRAGSIDYAHSTAVEFVERAKRALRAFPAGPERDALNFLPDYVLSRDR
jgi:geranylgeranyl pyrophosphate synthase